MEAASQTALSAGLAGRWAFSEASRPSRSMSMRSYSPSMAMWEMGPSAARLST